MGAEALDAFFARMPRFAVALSGGCDSACLLAAAVHAGCEVRAYLVKMAFQPEFELADARRAARDAGVPLTVIEADVLAERDICANPPERCYLCKRFIFGRIFAHMREDGLTVLADGTNASDDPSRRPGFRALAEMGVVSPLRRAGLTKDEVRTLARTLGVATADKPSFPCLAAHIPHGEPIDERSLAQMLENTRLR